MEPPPSYHDLRYSSGHWYQRVNGTAWLKTNKKSAALFLRGNYTLSANLVMDRVRKDFHLDLAGNYYVDVKIRSAVNRFCYALPLDSEGCLKNGEYTLPDGRRMLLSADVHLRSSIFLLLRRLMLSV
jgi:hypothetical protein